ncbi:uncharacterized protein LOC134273385 [Saccostrea cucullata]|uniref:uncharacterized protein LOC134273385 n=1 Tax=Saccostrea cuccullata TaxID=36930 RepID=UPI002ED1AB6E
MSSGIETMVVSQFVESKVRKWFQLNNLKRDGFISKQDYSDMAETFTKEFDLDEKKAQAIRNWLENGWEILIKKGEEITAQGGVGGVSPESAPKLLEVGKKMRENGQISENEYIGAFKELVGFNKNLFVETFAGMVGSFFDAFDVNNTGYLTSQNFQKGMKCFGMTNTEAVDTMFKAMDTKKEGKIDKETYVGHWIEFMTGDNKEGVIAQFLCRM